MRVAIDIDGTFAVWPDYLGWLAEALLSRAFNSVVLLTGVSVPNPELADRAALTLSRRLQIDALPLPEPLGHMVWDVHVCIGRSPAEVAQLKAQYCREHDVHVLIDDSADYCAAVRELSPTTLVLHVWR